MVDGEKNYKFDLGVKGLIKYLELELTTPSAPLAIA